MEKTWLKSYPEGIPSELPDPPFRSVREIFEHSFDAWPERPAYTNMGTTLTYREVDELSMQFACHLQQDLGLTRGERVAMRIAYFIPMAMPFAKEPGGLKLSMN